MFAEHREKESGGQPVGAYPPSPQHRLLYSKKEAAQMLSVSIRQIDYFIAMKELIPRRLGKRVLISSQTLQEFSRRDHPGRIQ